MWRLSAQHALEGPAVALCAIRCPTTQRTALYMEPTRAIDCNSFAAPRLQPRPLSGYA